MLEVLDIKEFIKYPWAKCNSITFIPDSTDNSAEWTNLAIISLISVTSKPTGIPQVSSKGIELGATISHPPSSGFMYFPPSQGLLCEALRPACASCIAGTEPYC